MTKTFPCVLALILFGCTGGQSRTTDGGDEDGGSLFPVISVSGAIAVEPTAAVFLADAGKGNFELAGLNVQLEDPHVLALDPSDTSAVFGSQTVDAGGAFSVSEVKTESLVYGIAATVVGNPDAGLRCCPECGALPDAGCAFAPEDRVIPAATVLYDLTHEGGKPNINATDVKAYALPYEFHAKLNAAVTPARLLSLTHQTQSTLLGAGFTLGRIVDANGAPVSGAKIASPDTSVGLRVFYPTADLSNVTTSGTSSNGLFLYLFTGDLVAKQFTFTVEGKPQYGEHKVSAARGKGLLMTIAP